MGIFNELIASPSPKFEATAPSKFSDYTKREGCTSTKLPSILLGLYSLKESAAFFFFFKKPAYLKKTACK